MIITFKGKKYRLKGLALVSVVLMEVISFVVVMGVTLYLPWFL